MKLKLLLCGQHLLLECFYLFCIAEYYDKNNKHHRNYVIAETMWVIENIIHGSKGSDE